jgi:uncharacterized damage-inducible protein DinB
MEQSSISINLLKEQYGLVKDSRDVVFNFCESFKPSDYIKEVPGFGRGSICKTQLHIANTYTFWIANSVMKKSAAYLPYEPNDLAVVRNHFESVNSFMDEFINDFHSDLSGTISIDIPGSKEKTSASLYQVFTHVITHEFHHKGQMMSMGRILGYTPPDADIIRFT